MLPTSSTTDANVSRTPEAAREGVVGDGTLSWDSTADDGPRLPGPPLLSPLEFGGGEIGRPNPVCPKIERLKALGRFAQQREREKMTQDELYRVAREQRKAEKMTGRGG